MIILSFMADSCCLSRRPFPSSCRGSSGRNKVQANKTRECVDVVPVFCSGYYITFFPKSQDIFQTKIRLPLLFPRGPRPEAYGSSLPGYPSGKQRDIGALLEGNGFFVSFLFAFSLRFLLQLSAVPSIILVFLSPARAVGRKRILK